MIWQNIFGVESYYKNLTSEVSWLMGIKASEKYTETITLTTSMFWKRMK